MLADFVNGHNVRVVQPPGRFSLNVKALDQRRRGQLSGQNHLQRHRTIEAHLPGAIDHPHAAASDFFDQLIVAEIAQGAISDCGMSTLRSSHEVRALSGFRATEDGRSAEWKSAGNVYSVGSWWSSQGQQTRRATSRRAIAGKRRSALRTSIYLWHDMLIRMATTHYCSEIRKRSQLISDFGSEKRWERVDITSRYSRSRAIR